MDDYIRSALHVKEFEPNKYKWRAHQLFRWARYVSSVENCSCGVYVSVLRDVHSGYKAHKSDLAHNNVSGNRFGHIDITPVIIQIYGMRRQNLKMTMGILVKWGGMFSTLGYSLDIKSTTKRARLVILH